MAAQVNILHAWPFGRNLEDVAPQSPPRPPLLTSQPSTSGFRLLASGSRRFRLLRCNRHRFGASIKFLEPKRKPQSSVVPLTVTLVVTPTPPTHHLSARSSSPLPPQRPLGESLVVFTSGPPRIGAHAVGVLLVEVCYGGLHNSREVRVKLRCKLLLRFARHHHSITRVGHFFLPALRVSRASASLAPSPYLSSIERARRCSVLQVSSSVPI